MEWQILEKKKWNEIKQMRTQVSEKEKWSQGRKNKIHRISKNLKGVKEISSPDTEEKCDMWFRTIDLNAQAKLCIDFCLCGESKMFVLFHKPISCKETPFPVCLLTRSLWLQLYCRGALYKRSITGE